MMVRESPSQAVSAVRGFTLVELVVVMVVVGVLAIGVLPRFLTRADLDGRGFFDATESILRYAQKSAIAQRRDVCVAFSAAGAVPTTVTLTIASVSGGACDTPLTGPTGTSPHQAVAATGVAFSAGPAYPADFVFLPSGSASASRTFAVTGLAGRVGTVEAGTGYVHH
jgi:MSHA pilin protein MshC